MKKIVIDDSFNRFGWSKHRLKGELYSKGSFTKHSFAELDNFLFDLINSNDMVLFEKKLETIWGHFSFVYKVGDRVLVVVDKIRSIPLYYRLEEDQIILSAEATALVSKMSEKTIDPEGLLSFRMCGYTLGDRSLLSALKTINAGEYLYFNDRDLIKRKYFNYSPWEAKAGSKENFEKVLKEKTLAIFDRTVKNLKGKTIVVPISAGFDSRLVASALKEVGAPNVHCLSYGRPGNFDAETGKKVARALGFKWDFYPLDLKNQINYFRSEKFQSYLDFADSCSSVPFYQDNFVINQLAEKSIFPQKETVFINGNTGDFISGGHLPLEFKNLNEKSDIETIFYHSFIKKHCALWKNLLTEENKNAIKKMIHEELDSIGVELNIETAAGLNECLEYNNRQAKFVVSGQRSYEYFDYDWRLPLWDDEFIYFWQSIPREHKFDQNLYKRMLMNANWGGVWKEIPLNQKKINPKWVIPIRLAAKAFCYPLGRQKWHDIEKKYLAYFMEPLGLYSMWPYQKIVSDRRGPRNIVSWRSEQYLKDKGFLT